MDDYRAASLQGWSAVAPDWLELSERIDKQLKPAADWMLAAAALGPGEHVLELAGGTGTLSLLAAGAVGAEGTVLYSDFSDSMVQAARERFQAVGQGSIECRTIDAEAIDLPDGSVDAVLCRMGYMLMADPQAALRETARVLAPGGRVAFAVWTNPASNPWVAVPMQAVMTELNAPPPPPDAPGLWSLGEPGRLETMLRDAGFDDARLDVLDETTEFASAEEWIEGTRRLAAPLRALFANLDEPTRTAIEQRIVEGAKPFEEPDGRVTMPEQMLAATARVPG